MGFACMHIMAAKETLFGLRSPRSKAEKQQDRQKPQETALIAQSSKSTDKKIVTVHT